MKSILNNIKKHYGLMLAGLIAGLLLGWLFFHPGSSSERDHTLEEHVHEEESTIWTCSMHPQIKQDKPGLCPICAMDLVPLNTMPSSGEQVDPDEIQMTDAAARLADIQTITVGKKLPVKTIHLQGKVKQDERRIAELTARFGGRIETLYVNFTGQNVSREEKLATIYSPELVTAQKELLEAVEYRENRPALYRAAKNKLKLWDLTDDQISSIEENGEPLLYFDVLSPISGTVTMRHVAEGDYLSEGESLFKVVDLSRLWVIFDAYESDLP